MESTASLRSSTLLPSLSLPSSFPNFSKSRIKNINQSRRVSLSYASRRDAHDHQNSHNSSHRLIDENMIVLRKRIHEMKMVERNYEPLENWMEWEKRYYTSYDILICKAMGVLQSQLMNTRPSLALGMIVWIALSVPTSTAVVCSHLMEIARGILAGIHMI